MQLNTLWCYQGRDNAFRFMAITLASFGILPLVSLIFPQSVLILFVTLLSCVVMGLSTARRLIDAAKPLYWVLVPLLPHLLFGLSCYWFWPLGVISGIGLLGLACSVFISFFPAKDPQAKYVEGYFGVKSQPQAILGRARKRYEPQVFGQSVHDSARSASDAPKSSLENVRSEIKMPVFGGADENEPNVSRDPLLTDPNNTAAPRFGKSWQASHRFDVDHDALDTGSVTELLKSWLNRAKEHHVPLLWAAKITAVLLISGLIVWGLVSLTSGGSDTHDDVAISESPKELHVDRVSAKLPDGFWIVMQNDIFILRWLGDTGSAQNIWRLDTAKGDKACSELIFNDGSQYRPITVDLLSDDATEARFSPLDNKSIINHIAMRGSFKLCGYDFSLKGSQATLMQHQVFADYLPTN
ncbi:MULTISPECIES: hypothetical protein [Pseudomonadati]|uniref:DUF805 domain-containing protein n=1 Tax=Shewanella aestuarii TaxID=1028752 RepID=A0ABT0L3I7_9GAMM|nr:hypothetical protein [Shewanella aestuarii]MCL1118278.1 hypothetical protein [Shewanella aestuarii]GGN80308.1 hypothetical protein GCM10009193_25330 [Shewanella aestuarii]